MLYADVKPNLPVIEALETLVVEKNEVPGLEQRCGTDPVGQFIAHLKAFCVRI
jgi:hypothetical protein